MIKPTRFCLALLAAGFVFALLPSLVNPALWLAWFAFLMGALLCLSFDAWLATSPRRILSELRGPDELYVGASDPVELVVCAVGVRRPLRVELKVEVNDLLRPIPTRSISVSSEESVVVFDAYSSRRGEAKVEQIWMRWRGPLGLIERSRCWELTLVIPVLPDLRSLKSWALRFFGDREMLSGLKVERYLGDGSEFDTLREFQPGFDPRSLDWKASARHRKLLSREYRAERNHEIWVAIDSGHLMAEPLQGLAKLDHAIHAALRLAYCGLKSGDRVGLWAFDEAPRLHVASQAGVASLPLLQRRTAELSYSPSETNFTLGMTGLLQRLRRRALVVIFTDFADSVTAQLMLDNVQRLQRRHLVVFVALRDEGLDRISEQKPDSLVDVNRSVVASDFINERGVVLRRLQRLGVQCIDATPAEASARLIDHYLEIRRRELV